MDGVLEAEIYKNEEQIKRWIRERWLTGYDANGDAIGLYRFEDYAEEKYARSSLAGFGNVDLTYSGAMGRSIQISGFNKGEFEVFSTVGYYNKIVEKYGEVNFNITETEKNKLTDIIFIVIFNDINEAYG
jgi:hypothetical protein